MKIGEYVNRDLSRAFAPLCCGEALGRNKAAKEYGRPRCGRKQSDLLRVGEKVLEGVKVYTFGVPRAILANGASIRFRTRKASSLFFYLVRHSGKTLTRDGLCSTFWPDAESVSARNNLAVSLSSLRKQTSEDLISTDRVSVLCSANVACDANQFVRLVKRFNLASDLSDKLSIAFAAAELYEGPFLPDDDESWARAERFHLHEEFTKLLCFALDSASFEDHAHRALSIGVKALSWDPRAGDVRSRVQALKKRMQLDGRLRNRTFHQPSEARSFRDIQLMLEVANERKASSAPMPFIVGVIDDNSPHYITRKADVTLAAALRGNPSFILATGPPEVGKSSLLAKAIKSGRSNGYAVFWTDIGAIESEKLALQKNFYMSLMALVMAKLGNEGGGGPEWNGAALPSQNLERFVREILLSQETPVLWVLDGLGRVLEQSYGPDFMRLLKTWHDQRTTEPNGPWSKLTIAFGCLEELWMKAIRSRGSSCNVAIHLQIGNFGLHEFATLNQKHGTLLRNLGEIQDLYKLLGGQPALCQRAFVEMANGNTDLKTLLTDAADPSGPFREHLKSLTSCVTQDYDLKVAVTDILAKRPCDMEAFNRLQARGIVKGFARGPADFQCELYEQYLRSISGPWTA